jgi:thioredoxin-related protein
VTRTRIRSLGLAALLGLALAVPAGPAAAEVAWRGWEAGLREAQASKRPILVDVYTDWCGWCKRMDRDVYARADVRDYLARTFVAVKLDAEALNDVSYDGKTYTSRTLASHFRVTGYPTTLFLDPSGRHLVSVPGYVAGDRFLLMLRYIGDGHHARGVEFRDFAKSSAPR